MPQGGRIQSHPSPLQKGEDMRRKTILGLTVGVLVLSAASAVVAASPGVGNPGAEKGLSTKDLSKDKSFAGLVDIKGGRQVYMACQGKGSPTVVFISGGAGSHEDWTHLLNAGGELKPSDSAVFPQVGKFTRVCAYDRPGTVRFDGKLSPSTPVQQPTTAHEGAADLHALLKAAKQAGPYVLVGWSWGGLIARQYASDYPNEVSGLVLVDPASEFLEDTLTPAQWSTLVRLGTQPPEGVEGVDYGNSAPLLRAASPMRSVPSVVLTSDACFELLPNESTCQAWPEAQNLLVAHLDAEHITRTASDHPIQIRNPELVLDSVRQVVKAAALMSKP